jgi:hypothetical protein
VHGISLNVYYEKQSINFSDQIFLKEVDAQAG